jgi:hypothetical protein
VHPAARHRPMPGSGPRRHDARHRLIAPRACRKTSLPASHHCHPRGSERSRCAIDLAKIARSTADTTTKFLPRWAIRRRLPRPAQPLRDTLPHQIPIDGRLITRPPRVPSWGAFGRRPQHRWIGHDRPASETLHLLTRPDRVGGMTEMGPTAPAIFTHRHSARHLRKLLAQVACVKRRQSTKVEPWCEKQQGSAATTGSNGAS